MRRRRTEEELLEEDDDDDIQSRLPKVSRPIRSNHLQQILANRFYAGMVRNRDGNWIPSKSHQALVDERVFERVQENRKKRNQSIHYGKKLALCFRGICRCDDCKRVYTPYVQKGAEYFGSNCRPSCLNDNKNFPARFLEREVGLTISRLSFTDKELTVARLLLDGLSSNQIAEIEHNSPKTIRQHVTQIYAKCGVASRAQFFRLQARRGPQKAICAVAASLLTAIYHILKNGTEHHDLGAAYFDRRPTEVKASRLVARLKKLGFTVQLQHIAEAA